MFYHFKGTITAEDYQRSIQPGMRLSLIVFNVLFAILVLANLLLYTKIMLVGFLILIWLLVNAAIYFSPKFMVGKFKPQNVDFFITKEQLEVQGKITQYVKLDGMVLLVYGRSGTMIFKKEHLENQGQWEDFVTMTEQLWKNRKHGK